MSHCKSLTQASTTSASLLSLCSLRKVLEYSTKKVVCLMIYYKAYINKWSAMRSFHVQPKLWEISNLGQAFLQIFTQTFEKSFPCFMYAPLAPLFMDLLIWYLCLEHLIGHPVVTNSRNKVSTTQKKLVCMCRYL